MWMLIVVTSFWVHGTGDTANNYSFSPLMTEQRCEALKTWVEKRESTHSENKAVPQCVFMGK